MNKKALLKDVKVNIELKVLKKTTSMSIKEMCQRFTKSEVYDIIFEMEEAIDDIFDKEPASISCGRIYQKSRESMILI